MQPHINTTTPSIFWSRLGVCLSGMLLWSMPLKAEFLSELLVADPPLAAPELTSGFGSAVALRGDRAVVGAPITSLGPSAILAGRAFLVRRTQEGWVVEQELFPDSSPSFGRFGASVALDATGDTVLVGQPGGLGVQGTYSGTVWVFTNSSSGYTVAGRLVAPDATTSGFGVSLALKGDTLVVGTVRGPGALTDGTGAGVVHVRSGTSWPRRQILQSGVNQDGFGAALAMDPTGNWLAIGAPRHLGGRGAVYVYQRTVDTWSMSANFTVPGGDPSDAFGTAVAVNEDAVLVGAPGATNLVDTVRINSGLAYLYHRTGTSWTSRTLAPAGGDARPEAMFGAAVAIAPNAVAVAAPGQARPGSPPTHGAVFLFARTGGAAELRRVLEGSNSTAGLGWTLEIEGNRLLTSGTASGEASWRLFPFRLDYSDGDLVAGLARKLLYYPEAEDGGIFARLDAAFEFRHRLFEADPEDAEQRILARYQNVDAYYGEAEKLRAARAEALVRQALAHSNSVVAQDTLLDLYYDRTLAETIRAREVLAGLEVVRLNPPNQPNGFVIDDEIAILDEGLRGLETALDQYFLPLEEAVPSGDAPPLVAAFKSRVPLRPLEPPFYLSPEGSLLSATGNGAPLFDGYRDAALLVDLLRDRVQTAAELARAKLARRESGEESAVVELLGATKTEAMSRLAVLRRLLPAMDAYPDLRAGLTLALSGLRQALAECDTLAGRLKSNENMLGFTDDFLLLVQRFQGQGTNIFDSFNAYRAWLDPNGSSALASALREWNDAQDAYAHYRNRLDQLQEQRRNLATALDDRLFELVGVRRGQPGYSTPENVVGGEIWQQLQSIEVARLRIQRNQAEISNLHAMVRIETERRLRERNLNASISDVRIRYGDRYSRIEEELAKLEAVQAAASSVGDAAGGALGASSLGTGGVTAIAQLGAGAVNATAAYEKGKLNAQKERFAALEQAEIDTLQDDLLDANSKAQIKTWMLEMNTLAIDSLEAALLLRQELGRLAAFVDEISDLERRLAEASQELDQRYFADPAHRLRSRHTSVRADLKFAEAQRWLFFMVRALEYKWNTPFQHTFAGRDYSSNTLFRCRQAGELLDFYQAMLDFDALLDASDNSDDYYDWFSVREDFLGLRLLDDAGQPLTYQDRDTGETVGAVEMFRRTLRRLADEAGTVRLRFSTVRELPGGTFFRGPRFLPDGQLDDQQKGLYLDKIRWMKIRLPGSHASARNQRFVTGSLTYGGLSYLRNFNVGTFDPERPDRLLNELRTYGTRYWYYDPQQARWQSNAALSIPVQMWLTTDPRQEGSAQLVDVLPSVQQIEGFKERSVAASQWTLVLPTRDLGTTILSLDELDDIEIYFYHYAAVRQ